MKKLLPIYKTLSLVELILLINILVHYAVFILKRSSTFIDTIFVFFFFAIFLATIIINWKIISLTTGHRKATETFVIVGHIANISKLLALLLLITAGIFFYSFNYGVMTLENEWGVLYYVFYLTFFLFVIVSFLTFASYFGITAANRNSFKNMISSIDSMASRTIPE